MRVALLQIGASTFMLLVLAMWPRAGQPILLVLPPGAPAGAAFAAEGWRVQRIAEAGPFRLVVATPDSAAGDAAVLRRASGAVLALAARALVACAPGTR
ncbi:hypothetical protein [Roseomonas fluvialis]|uniref:Uncharacterized protein n=1 Tax=Roseomonas fluvialis TaxID=1750527 RepID=A0ABM7Y9S8_9PROT|nr:hypothetical protein [Roseomonas fluvialis]BDG74837.1 hypothetical protein Rmf_47660 [Roseomonas fluvialis]